MVLIRNWNRIYQAPPEPRPWYSVLLWWEFRRIPYNAIMGSAGLIAVLLLYLVFRLPPLDPQMLPEDDFLEPLSIVAFAVMANVMYTLGWITELAYRNIRPNRSPNLGPRLFRYGLRFSLLLIALPVILNAGAWMIRVYGGR